MKRDYYEILGVAREASDLEVRKAYRAAALRWHPDRNQGNPDAAQTFKEVTEAYTVLNDSTKRATYDRFGHTGAAPSTAFDKKRRAMPNSGERLVGPGQLIANTWDMMSREGLSLGGEIRMFGKMLLAWVKMAKLVWDPKAVVSAPEGVWQDERRNIYLSAAGQREATTYLWGADNLSNAFNARIHRAARLACTICDDHAPEAVRGDLRPL